MIEKEFLEGKGFNECYNISFPVLIEKKYAFQKGGLFHRGKYVISDEGQKIMEIKCVSNNRTVFYGNSLIEGINYEFNKGIIFFYSDKNFYIIQEIDPVFLAIYYLDHARGKVLEYIILKKSADFFLKKKTSEMEGKFLKLEEIICHQTEKENNFYNLLANNKRFLRGLDLICDKKQIGKNYYLSVKKKYVLINQNLKKFIFIIG